MRMGYHQRHHGTWTAMDREAVKDVAKKILNEMDTESSGSSEAETESPRSFVQCGSTLAKDGVHIQLLRIMEEELCVVVEDKATCYCREPEDRRHIHPRRLNLLLISRSILPRSPLSGKVSTLKAVQ